MIEKAHIQFQKEQAKKEEARKRQQDIERRNNDPFGGALDRYARPAHEQMRDAAGDYYHQQMRQEYEEPGPGQQRKSQIDRYVEYQSNMREQQQYYGDDQYQNY